MDKSTNVHHKVAATFVSTYYNAIAEGKIAEVTKMYTPTAKVNHWNIDGTSALNTYAKGARITVAEMDPRLVDNTHLKVFVKGTITITGEQKKDFQHDIELYHHSTSASQLSFGVAADFLRGVTAVPPPPKMKFDDWAADTPTLNAQAAESESVPDIDLVKAATPKPTPKISPALAPAAPAPVVEEKKAEEPKAEEKKEEVKAAPTPAPAAEAPKGWASIVRSQAQGTKAVVSVVDPTKKVAEKKKEVVEEKKEKVTEEKEKKEKEESPKERRSAKSAAPIFYDVFVKGFPESITESEVPTALGLKVAVSNTKIDTKTDKSGVRRVFVYIKLSAEDLVKQNTTREEAIGAIIANNKNTKYGNSRLSVEEVKERYNSDAPAAKKDSNKK